MHPVNYNHRAEADAHHAGHSDVFEQEHHAPAVNGVWTAEDQAAYIKWRHGDETDNEEARAA